MNTLTFPTRFISIHEAGHAALAYHLRRNVEVIRILEEEGYGYVRFTEKKYDSCFGAHDQFAELMDKLTNLRRDAIIGLGGLAAEAIVMGLPVDAARPYDDPEFKEIERLAEQFGGGIKEYRNQIVDDAWVEACTFLRTPCMWAGVRALNKALRTARFIRGPEGRRIFSGAIIKHKNRIDSAVEKLRFKNACAV